MRIEWSEHAVSDLQAICEYIESDRDLATANRIARKIYDSVQTLRRLPYRGRNGRLENTRELVVPNLPWTVIYRVSSQSVTVLNIVHGAQRWP
jgi:toxin ParE1/3/4